MTVLKWCAVAAAALSMAACAQEQTATEPEAQGTTTLTATHETTAERDAEAVESELRTRYGNLGGEIRYFGATTDLDGDGKHEIIVHVVSPMLCGTGGCNTLVLTPTEAGYRLVTEISVSRPPIQVSSRSSNGWRNLIVRVAGGGVAAHSSELHFDGTSYPENPSVPPAEPATDTAGAEILIAEYSDFTQGTLVPR
jgi:hypothetical protein